MAIPTNSSPLTRARSILNPLQTQLLFPKLPRRRSCSLAGQLRISASHPTLDPSRCCPCDIRHCRAPPSTHATLRGPGAPPSFLASSSAASSGAPLYSSLFIRQVFVERDPGAAATVERSPRALGVHSIRGEADRIITPTQLEIVMGSAEGREGREGPRGDVRARETWSTPRSHPSHVWDFGE